MVPAADSGEDAIWVGEEMSRRFGLPRWQFCLTATDANRFVLRLARQITGRPLIVVHNWCYHGSVDETIASLDPSGRVVPREGSVGPAFDVSETTRVVEINDLEALRRALSDGLVASVLVEPALTNIGIVLPDPGRYWYDVFNGVHRFYGSVAAGFTHLPAQVFPPSALAAI